jgi:hypothetical protein
MTLEWLRQIIWQKLGKPTDLNPATDVQYEGKPLLNYVVNEAQRRIASWKDPRTGRSLRIRTLMSDLFFQAKVIEGTLEVNAPADNQVTLPAGDVSNDDDQYNGWILEVEQERTLVVDYASYVATIYKEWDCANPEAGDDYRLYKNFFYLTTVADPWSSDHIVIPTQTTRFRAIGNLVEPLKIRLPEQQLTLKKVGEDRDFMAYLWTVGDPSQWNQIGRKIFMNRQLDEAKWYQLFYYRLPTELSNDSDEQEIPEMFVNLMIMWGVWWGLDRNGESSRAYSTKRNIDDELQRILVEADVSLELDDDFGMAELE